MCLVAVAEGVMQSGDTFKTACSHLCAVLDFSKSLSRMLLTCALRFCAMSMHALCVQLLSIVADSFRLHAHSCVLCFN